MIKKVDGFYFDPSEVVACVPERCVHHNMALGYKFCLRGGAHFIIFNERSALKMIEEVLSEQSEKYVVKGGPGYD